MKISSSASTKLIRYPQSEIGVTYYGAKLWQSDRKNDCVHVRIWLQFIQDTLQRSISSRKAKTEQRWNAAWLTREKESVCTIRKKTCWTIITLLTLDSRHFFPECIMTTRTILFSCRLKKLHQVFAYSFVLWFSPEIEILFH